MSREKDSGILTSTKVRTYSYSPPPSPASVTFVAKAERSYMVGQDIPNFYKRKAAGELLPHTHFVQSRWSGGHTSGSYSTRKILPAYSTASVSNHHGPTSTSFSWRVYEMPDYDCESLVLSLPDSEGFDYLVQQAAARIYAKGVDSLTFLSELPSLKKAFTKIAKTIRTILRDRRTMAQSSRELQETWLEGRYAWRTLGFDIRDFYQAVTDFDSKRQLYSERVGLSYTDSGTETLMSNSNQQNLLWTITRSWNHNHSLRGSVTGRITPARFQFNPLVTGWELLQLSFILDWVYDIGTSLEALSFLTFSSEFAASNGSRTKSSVNYVATASASSTHTGSASVKWDYEGEREVRTPCAINIKPQLTGRIISGEQALDLTSIARLRMRL